MLDGGFEYIPRKPEETLLYGVAAELETFLARQQARERPVPRFEERQHKRPERDVSILLNAA